MKKTILFIFLVLLTNSFAHKSYLSIANMNYNLEEKRVEVSLKLIAHDFEQLLSHHFKRKLILEDIKENREVKLMIENYVNSKFKLYSGNKIAIFNYVGKELTIRDELFFYFTFTEVIDPSHIKVSNFMLFELFSKQQNIVHYTYSGIIKSITLTADHTIGELKF